MIDTIRLIVSTELASRELPSGWTQRSTTTRTNEPSDGLPIRRDGLLYEHTATGLRAGGASPFLNWVEVSLPRLLYGHNGRLITTQTELDEALRRLFDLLREIGQPHPESLRFSRLDFVWHFSGNLNQFVLAFEHAKHKSIRKLASGYANESIFWVGHGLQVRVYDKIRQLSRRAGDVLRVEVQLRGRRLKKYLAHDAEEVEILRLSDCYRAYREILLGFSTVKPPAISSWAHFFALAQLAGWKYEDCTPFALWAVGKSKEHVRRMRRQMAAVRLEYFEFDFCTLLPADELPPIIEVDCRGLKLNPEGIPDTGASPTDLRKRRE